MGRDEPAWGQQSPGLLEAGSAKGDFAGGGIRGWTLDPGQSDWFGFPRDNQTYLVQATAATEERWEPAMHVKIEARDEGGTVLNAVEGNIPQFPMAPTTPIDIPGGGSFRLHATNNSATTCSLALYVGYYIPSRN